MSSKYQFVADHASQYPVALLCRVLGVSRSGYYAWCTRAESRRSRENRTLEVQIRALHAASRGTYGSPPIHAELIAQGVRCSEKRVARLMRRAGVRAKQVRRTKATTDSHHALPVAENVLNREFGANAPNTKWVADITYISTRAGWLYLDGQHGSAYPTDRRAKLLISEEQGDDREQHNPNAPRE